MCDCSYHCEARRQGDALRRQKYKDQSTKTEGGQRSNAIRDCLKKFEDINKKKTSDLSKEQCNRVEENNPIYRGYLLTTLNEGCGLQKERLYLKMYQDLRRRGRMLHSWRMCQGPDDAFLDYFPPGFVPGKSKPIVVQDTQYACLRPKSPEQQDEKWKKKFQELHNHELHLYNHFMVMGPHDAFPEYFPPDFDHDAKKKFPKPVSSCTSRCGGEMMPTNLFLTNKCRFLTHIPLSYVPQYKKYHHIWPNYCFEKRLH